MAESSLFGKIAQESIPPTKVAPGAIVDIPSKGRSVIKVAESLVHYESLVDSYVAPDVHKTLVAGKTTRTNEKGLRKSLGALTENSSRLVENDKNPQRSLNETLAVEFLGYHTSKPPARPGLGSKVTSRPKPVDA